MAAKIKLTADNYIRFKMNELYEYMQAVLRTKMCPDIMKENVENRYRVLVGEGYRSDVALSMAMKENNLLA